MFGSLIAFLAAFGLLFELASNEMYKHYRIYEKGITDVSAHFNPFSNCDKLMTKGEENFYLWDVFEGFKKKETEDELLIMLYVDMGVFNKALKEGGVRPKNLSIYYPKDPVGKVAFDDVVSILKKVVGNEIHYTCRVCRTITSEGKDRCDNCVKHGYEEN